MLLYQMNSESSTSEDVHSPHGYIQAQGAGGGGGLGIGSYLARREFGTSSSGGDGPPQHPLGDSGYGSRNSGVAPYPKVNLPVIYIYQDKN